VLDSAFIGAALTTFGKGNELFAICGPASSPTAVAILKRVGLAAWETFQPSQLPLSAWMHSARTNYSDLLAALIQVLPGTALMVGITQKDPDLQPRPQESPNLKVLDYIQTARLDVNRPFSEFWLARDKKVRYEIQRRLKRLAESGLTPRIEVLTDPSDVPDAIDDYGRMEMLGWKGKAGTAVHGDNKQGAFYRSVLANYCALGKGRIFRLYFGDRLVAMQLCIESDDTLVFLKTAYDESLRQYSPGILMKHAIFEHLFNEGKLKRIEFFGVMLDWQTKWSDGARVLYHVNYYKWSWLKALHNACRLTSARITSCKEAVPNAVHTALDATRRCLNPFLVFFSRVKKTCIALPERLRTLRLMVNAIGWLDATLYLSSWLTTRLTRGRASLRKYCFVKQPVNGQSMVPIRRGTSVRVRQVFPGDILVKNFPRPRNVIESRFKQGAVCLAAEAQDKFAGFVWLRLGPHEEDEVHCSYVPVPERKCSWDFDIYVSPESRAGIVFLRLWEEANKYLMANGIQWTLSRISAFNPSSRRSHRRLGAEHIGSALFLSFGSWQWTLATIHPHFHLSTRPDSFPTFQLHATSHADT